MCGYEPEVWQILFHRHRENDVLWPHKRTFGQPENRNETEQSVRNLGSTTQMPISKKPQRRHCCCSLLFAKSHLKLLSPCIHERCVWRPQVKQLVAASRPTSGHHLRRETIWTTFTRLRHLSRPCFVECLIVETPMKLVTFRVVVSLLSVSLVSAGLAWSPASVHAQDRSLSENPELAAYFEDEVSQLEKENDLTRFKSLDEWHEAKPHLREQLFEMLGLRPRPEKTDLQAAITGTTEEDEFVVERVHFQSLPGLYVTGNFYRPKVSAGPLPTILYVCGHGQVKKDGVSFGNKTHYHYHGAWFARNGYNCLIIDTLQLGEIEGVHHGTYKMNRWWWNSRGYTPAGVEAWNCIRALDYLETRAEVNAKRIGVSGRSGGGAYSWWIAALDDRIQCAVPVAGITSLRDHVVNGCVEGHCDCMYMVNTFRWDFATVAALVAPRPLLISNTDKDTIFPLEGVIDIHRQVRHIYRLHGKGDHLGLQITEGPHKDTQELHIHAFRWFNRFLRDDETMIEKTAEKFFQPEQLKVFAQLPSEEINTRVDETFVALAAVPSADAVLADQQAWFNGRLAELRERCFQAWPDHDSEWKPSASVRVESLPIAELDIPNADGLKRLRIHFQSQSHVPLFVDAVLPENQTLDSLKAAAIHVAADPESVFREVLKDRTKDSDAVFVMSPRGLGPHQWIGTEDKQNQIQRRFQLIGTTADAMRVWDIRRAIQSVQTACPNLSAPPTTAGDQMLEPHVLLASLFEPSAAPQSLHHTSADPNQWPSILNLTRTIRPEEILSLVIWHSGVKAKPSSVADARLDLGQKLSSDSRWTGASLLLEDD